MVEKLENSQLTSLLKLEKGVNNFNTNLSRRGFLANAPKENMYFKHNSPLALAAKVWYA